MARRMPVLSREHMGEMPGDAVRHRHDRLALRHRERAGGAEVVLGVDDDQHIMPGEMHRHRYELLLRVLRSYCAAAFLSSPMSALRSSSFKVSFSSSSFAPCSRTGRRLFRMVRVRL